MTKYKMKKISGKIIGIIICCILVVSYILYAYMVECGISDKGSIETFGENAVWKYGVLLEGDRVLSSEGLLYYTNMSKKMTVPLCTRAGCEHNTDDCTACYMSNNDFMYPYQGNMYLGCMADKYLEFFRTNLDGSGREKIATYYFDDVISETQYLQVDSKVYIAVAIESASRMEITDDGTCYDVPVYWELLCFDLNSAKYEKVGAIEGEYYGYSMYLRYLEGNRIYYEFDGRTLPWDEMYHPETGKLLKPELRENEIEGVASINLDTGQIRVEDRYETGDYVGTESGISYFLEYQNDHILSGDIRLENSGIGQEKIHIKDLEQKEGILHILKDHFVFNEVREEQRGRISFFDRSGNSEFVLENVDKYILGEWESYYIICSIVLPQGMSCMSSYIKKKDIKQLQTKAVRLIDD